MWVAVTSYVESATLICELRFGCSKIIYFITVQPQPPDITHAEIIGSKTIVRGTEDQSVTLTCVSRGGYPEPMVNWMRGSSFLDPTSHTSQIDGDGNFIVTTEYTFTVHRNDDRVTYSCQSSLGGSDQPLVSSVVLFLKRKSTIISVILDILVTLCF